MSLTPEKKLVDIAFITKEEYPIHEIITCYSILSDKAFLIEQGVIDSDDKTRRAIKHRLDILGHILNTQEPCPNGETFTRTVSYGYLKPHKAGRIYPQIPAVSTLPRDLRFLLFKDRYTDWDLKNAHPTILYEFAEERGLQAPLLKELVINRDGFRDTVSRELPQKNDIKKEILVAFYTPGGEYHTKSSTLNDLNMELDALRDEIVHYYEELDPPVEFGRSVTAQSWYCMTRESQLLMGLYHHITERLGGDSLLLHYIPVFDGVLMKHDKFSEGLRLRDLVEEFNATLSYSRFVEKKFEEDPQAILTQQEFDVHLAVRKKLCTLKAADIPKLAEALGLDPFALPETLVIDIIQGDLDRKEHLDELKNQRNQEPDKLKRAQMEKQLNEFVSTHPIDDKLSRKVLFECIKYQGLLRETLFELEIEGGLDDYIHRVTTKNTSTEPETPFLNEQPINYWLHRGNSGLGF